MINADVGRCGGVQLDPGSIQTTPRHSVPEVFGLILGVAALRASGTLPFSDLAYADLAYARLAYARLSKMEKAIRAPVTVEGTTFRRRHVPCEQDVCPFRDLMR